jgi:hypothetical protein
MENIDPDKREAALLARLEAEREQRLAEKIAAGEIVSVSIYVVAGSKTAARAQVEQAKATKLAELRAANDMRDVVFAVNVVITGVCQYGEAADPASEPSAPSFASREDGAAAALPLPTPTAVGTARAPDARTRKKRQKNHSPPVIETPICVQTRACHDADDPGEVREGWYSVEGKSVTVTDTRGEHVGSRTMLKGEDARVVAKQLLREKTPESESFNRRLFYPNAGLA